VPEPGAPRYPVSLGFELETIDAPVIVARIYEMTIHCRQGSEAAQALLDDPPAVSTCCLA
jgi:hypothetical protein